MQELIQAIKEQTVGNAISCKAALDIAHNLQMTPAVVGAAINNQGIKIIGCQLGCFK